MNIFNKTLIAAAITGLVAIPAANAELSGGAYSANAKGSIKINGQRCKTFKANKLNATLLVSDGFEGYFEGFEGFEGGSNTGQYIFNMATFGAEIDGNGPLITSNKGRTYNMDTSLNGYWDLNSVMDDYIFGLLDNEGCKTPGSWNYDVMINRYEAKVSNNGKRVKLKMDAEGTYYDSEKDKDQKASAKVTATMDEQDLQ